MGYVALIREKRFADAYRTIKEDNPFPSVCGRVCNHKCEEACTRGENGHEAVNIMHLKRFVTDWAFAHPEEVQKAYAAGIQKSPDTTGLGKKVAIIGAGPAGMTAANDLIAKNFEVTVFEALPAAGGMMRVGIPEYRMPYDLVQKEVDEIIARGVELKLNSRVDDAAGLLGEYQAVFVATGAHVGLKTGIPGNDLPDVHVATDFLRSVSLRDSDGKPPDVKGKRVLVLGGGNVAVDAAMSSVRLGASWVGMTCLEGEGKMLAHDWEVRDCRDEGIDVMPGRNFLEITNKDGKVTGVRTVNVNFRGFVDGKIDHGRNPRNRDRHSLRYRYLRHQPETGPGPFERQGRDGARPGCGGQKHARDQRSGHFRRRRCGHRHNLGCRSHRCGPQGSPRDCSVSEGRNSESMASGSARSRETARSHN